jgi:hypothetical protein
MILKLAAADGATIVPWHAIRAKDYPRILTALATVMLVVGRFDQSLAAVTVFAHRRILPYILCKKNATGGFSLSGATSA